MIEIVEIVQELERTHKISLIIYLEVNTLITVVFGCSLSTYLSTTCEGCNSSQGVSVLSRLILGRLVDFHYNCII